MIGIFHGRGVTERARAHAQIDVDMRSHVYLFNNGKNLNAFAVFLCIALHADKDGWSRPSQGLLKKETGLSTDHAISGALKHLRQMRINGQRILAHYRVRHKDKRFGQSAYLIFPDLPHGEGPFENLEEFYPEKQESDKPYVDDPHAVNPHTDDPHVDDPHLQEEPPTEAKPDSEVYPSEEKEDSSSADAPDQILESDGTPRTKNGRKRTAQDDMFDAVAWVLYGVYGSDQVAVLSTGARKNAGKAAKRLRDVEVTPADLREWWEWWRVYDWRGKQGQRPTPSQLTDSWPAFEAWRRNPTPPPAQNGRPLTPLEEYQMIVEGHMQKQEVIDGDCNVNY